MQRKFLLKKNFFYKILKKIIFSFLIQKESWRLFRNIFYEEVSLINKSNCDYIIFPSQNRAGYLTKKIRSQ